MWLEVEANIIRKQIKDRVLEFRELFFWGECVRERHGMEYKKGKGGDVGVVSSIYNYRDGPFLILLR